MPYRRLPNTDSARLKALYCAQKKGQDLPPFKLAYTQGTFQRVQNLLPSYEHALSEYKIAYNNQLEKNKDYQRYARKAKLYISHFIQVIDMAITRGDLPVSTKTYFGIPEDEKRIPSLNTDEEIIEWGKKLIDGEQQRRMEGQAYISNPTVALVKVHYDKFYEVFGYQNSLKKRASRAQDELNDKRAQADQIIQQLWNEVESTYKGLPDNLKREKASEYGIIYVFRKNELNDPQLMKALHINMA